MRKFKLLLSAAAIMLLSPLCTIAQNIHSERPERPQHQEGMMGERPARNTSLTAKERAEQRAFEMDKAVRLDDKQHKKIYKIFLKEENAIDFARGLRGPGMGGPGMGGPGMGGPGMGGPAMRADGVTPPQGGMNAEGGNMANHANQIKATIGGKDINSEEYINKREEKIRQILRPEQYKKWRETYFDSRGRFQRR